jgi:hypothetical protein
LKETFPLGITSVANQVKLSAEGTEPISAKSSFDVEVIPTPTPMPSPTAVPPTPTPAPVYEPAGPTAGGISRDHQALLAGGFIALAIVGIIVVGYLIGRGKEIPDAFRDSFVLAMIMGTVIILGLAGSVERSAIAGLIGTVAGYVLRAAVTKP